MDEEELEQSDSKISIGSFFERIDSVEKVAGKALSKANANFGIIEKQRAIINSLNISIEAIETKVRDIANYIIVEKKIRKDEESDRLFEEQDKEQKDKIIERLMGMKGDQGDQGEPGQPAEEEKGNPIMSFLKSLATLGIAAFVTTQIWPVLLPLVGPLLGKLGLGLLTVTGVGLGGFLGAQLLKVPLVGKKLGPKVDEGIQSKFKEVGESVQKAAENIGKDGNLDIPAVSGGELGEGGAEEVEDSKDTKKNIMEGNSVETMEDTLAENDLVSTEDSKEGTGTKDPRIDKVYEDLGFVTVHPTNEFGGDKADKDVQPGDYMGIANGYTYNYLEHARNLVHSRERKLKMAEMYPQDKERHLRGAERLRLKIIDFDKRFPQVTELLIGKDKQYYEDMKNYSVEGDATNNGEPQQIEATTENKDLDLSLNNVQGGEDGSMTGINDANLLSQVLQTPSSDNGQVVTAPSNTPNTTDTTVKLTKVPIPFLNSISNSHLSITGDEVPPEFYRQYA